MEIKAICFDLDGVYFTPESFQRFKKAISKGVDDEIVNNVLYKSNMMLSFKKGEISENEYWDFVRSELKINFENEQIFEILKDSYEVNPKIVELVRTVREKGYKTCICSNNFETRIRELNKKFDFLKDFDVHIFSYKTGVMKPDKKIYEALIRESHVNADQIVYSDDSSEKLVGANELGIHTFVFESVEGFVNKLRGFNIL